MTIHFLPALSFSFLFLKRRLAPAHICYSLCKDQSTVAQRAKTTVAECSLASCVLARFRIGSHTMPGQRHNQSTRTLRWIKDVCVFRCTLPPAPLTEWPESFTCHCGKTGVERTPNKCQHTKLTLEKKIFRRSFRDSNSQPFDDESGTLTAKLSRLLLAFLNVCKSRTMYHVMKCITGHLI